MKFLVLFILAAAVLVIVAQAMGWKNFGNLPPVVATKIAQIRGEPGPPLLRRTIVPAESVLGLGQRTCRDFLDAEQGQQSVAAYLDWVEGFLTARSVENPIPAHLLARPNLHAALKSLCAATPEQTIAAAAAALAEQFMSQTLR